MMTSLTRINAKGLWSNILTAAVIIICFRILISLVDWLRISAGVASDTCTPFDVLAWLGCIFTVAMIAGSLTRWLRQSAGLLGVVVIFLVFGMVVGKHLIYYDGFSAALGAYTLPALVWVILSGLASGWFLNVGKSKNRYVYIAITIFAGALITLILVFYPVERYFMSVWGNG